MFVNSDPTNGQVVKFFRSMRAVDPKLTSPEYATFVVVSAIEAGIITGGTVEDVDGMRTGNVVVLAGEVNRTIAECLKPDPN